MVLGSSKTLVNFFSQCAKQCATLHCALGMESKVCLFSARPWDEANMLENLVRVHLLAKEKYQMVRIGAAEGQNIWCVGMYHGLPYVRHRNPLLSVFVS